MSAPAGERRSQRRRLGLIVNPVAGLGGRVGLKGSDGAHVQQRARELGAQPQAQARAAQALAALAPLSEAIHLFTPPADMGEWAARQTGFEPLVLGKTVPGSTTAEDTRRAALAMLEAGVDLLLFAGGDGTARDIYSAIEQRVPVLGIPAGVKIHSAAFAVNPRRAGELALEYLRSSKMPTREVEVIDLDEESYRAGILATGLYGYLRTPYRRQFVQSQKTPTPASEAVQARAIAADVIEGMQPEALYLLGPGTAPRAIAERLGLPKTLLGVDVISAGQAPALDVGERRILELIENRDAKIIVTPIGGQGFLLGRGNQQISPRVLRQVGKDNLIVVSLPHKLDELRGRPLLVDTGDASLDDLLSGYIEVVSGYHERIIYRVVA